MNLHLPGAFRILALLTIAGVTTIRAGSTEAPQISSASGWTLDFKQNSKLPQGFRQFSTIRGDGTIQTGFLVDVNHCLTKRKPLMIYVSGSGAQSEFFHAPDRSGRANDSPYCSKRWADSE
jgi:hypothetical protein